MIKTSLIYKLISASLVLSILGFILDMNEHVPNVVTNLKDISLMTLFFFVCLAFSYGFIHLIVQTFRRLG